MRVRVNFTVSSNIVTDILISDNINSGNAFDVTDAIEEEVLRMLHENTEGVIDKGGCLTVDFHDYQVIK